MSRDDGQRQSDQKECLKLVGIGISISLLVCLLGYFVLSYGRCSYCGGSLIVLDHQDPSSDLLEETLNEFYCRGICVHVVMNRGQETKIMGDKIKGLIFAGNRETAARDFAKTRVQDCLEGFSDANPDSVIMDEVTCGTRKRPFYCQGHCLCYTGQMEKSNFRVIRGFDVKTLVEAGNPDEARDTAIKVLGNRCDNMAEKLRVKDSQGYLPQKLVTCYDSDDMPLIKEETR